MIRRKSGATPPAEANRTGNGDPFHRAVGLPQIFRFFQALLQELMGSPRGRGDLGVLVRYCLAVNEGSAEPLRRALAEPRVPRQVTW